MKKIMISLFILSSAFIFAEGVQEITGTFNNENIESTVSETQSKNQILPQETNSNGSEETITVEGEPEVAPETTRGFYEYRPQSLIALDAQMEVPANRGKLGQLNAEYEQALTAYLEANSYDSDRIFFLANEYMLLNNYDRANKIFLKDNKDIKNIFGAATTYRFMGQNANAIEKYNQVLSINSSFAEAYLGRGLAYRNMDNYDDAARDLKNYLSMTSAHEGYVALADVYFKMGKNREAYDIANQGLSRYRDSRILKTLANNILKNKID